MTPRRLAASSCDSIMLSALTVALSCMVLFLEPRTLTPTSVMPSRCSKCCAIRPALTPLPVRRGQSSTFVAPSFVCTAWYTVRPRYRSM